jgi:hypothetical protein
VIILRCWKLYTGDNADAASASVVVIGICAGIAGGKG